MTLSIEILEFRVVASDDAAFPWPGILRKGRCDEVAGVNVQILAEMRVLQDGMSHVRRANDLQDAE